MSVVAGIQTQRLHRVFTTRQGDRRLAVDDLTLTVRPGELVSLLGPNGAGKTTTVRMLTGLLLPTGGTAMIDGNDVVRHRRRAALRRGFSLGGDTGLYPRLTAAQNLSFFGLMYDLRGASLRRRARDLLDAVGLADRADSLVSTLSRGMKQRLHLARALLHDPPVLILDEPSAGLDPQSAAAMRTLVSRLRADGRAILLTTHDMREAEELSDRIVLMKDGRVHTESTAAELRQAAAAHLGHALQVVFAIGRIPDEVEECPGLLRQEADGPTLTMRVTDGAKAVEWILATFPGMTSSVSVTMPTLEEVFLHLVAQP